MAEGWELKGRRPGGTVTALAGARMADGAIVIFAGTAIGPFISSDEGQTWTRLGEQWSPPAVVSVALSPAFERDRTVFLGTRDTLYRSTDGGATWRPSIRGSMMLTIALSPAFESDQVLFVGTDADGIIRSRDAGRTWVSVNAGLLDPTVLNLSLSPHFPDDGTGFAATPFGLYRTRNGGQSWREVELSSVDASVQCIFISPTFSEDGLVLVGTEEAGMLRSTDHGTRWEQVSDITEQSVNAIVFTTGTSPQTLFAVTDDGVYNSQDGGVSWQGRGRTPAPAFSLMSIPTDEGHALLAGQFREGVSRSSDAGQTWTTSNDGLHARLTTGLLISPAFANNQTLFVTDLESGVLRSTDGGITWEASTDGLEFISGPGVSPSVAAIDGHTLWAGTDTGLFRSRDGGATWEEPGNNTPSGPIGVVATSRNGLIVTIEMDGQVTTSADGGETWVSAGHIKQTFASVSIALSPNVEHDHTFFATLSEPRDEGAYRLSLLRSHDSGATWEQIHESQGQSVMPVAVPSTYPSDGVLFIGTGNTVIKESPAGSSRVELGQDLFSITSLATSPDYEADSTVFAASDAGIYVSRDAGVTFTNWSENLNPSSIVALALSPEYERDRLVYAVGLGGTIWRRQDSIDQ